MIDRRRDACPAVDTVPSKGIFWSGLEAAQNDGPVTRTVAAVHSIATAASFVAPSRINSRFCNRSCGFLYGAASRACPVSSADVPARAA